MDDCLKTKAQLVAELEVLSPEVSVLKHQSEASGEHTFPYLQLLLVVFQLVALLLWKTRCAFPPQQQTIYLEPYPDIILTILAEFVFENLFQLSALGFDLQARNCSIPPDSLRHVFGRLPNHGSLRFS